jgi:hypothetical protein
MAPAPSLAARGKAYVAAGVVSAAVALYFLFPGGGAAAAAAPPLPEPRFGDVELALFAAPQPAAPPAFSHSADGAGFTVTGAPAAGGAAQRGLVLFAGLAGPRDAHFGCFMAPAPGGAHTCPGAERLEPGDWAVEVVLMRRVAPGAAAAGCALAPRRRGAAAAAAARAPRPLRRYIFERNFSTFDEFRECFDYPHSAALAFTWRKTTASGGEGGESNIGAAPAAASALPICTGGERPGRWAPLDAAGGCAPARCAGAYDPAIRADAANGRAAKRIAHVWAPFDCRYRLFSAAEARACLAPQRLLLAGDSRVRNLGRHIDGWLGEGIAEYQEILYPVRVGLAVLLRQAEPRAALAAALAAGRTVVLSSLLHDIGNFRNDTRVADIRAFWGDAACPAARCPRGDVLGCPECLTKRGAPQAYRAHLRELAALVAAGRAAGGGRVLWMSQHKRRPVVAEEAHTWQFSDVLDSLEDMAARVLGAAGAAHVDLRPALLAAPARWWDDKVHWGLADRNSLFKHMTLQVLLNRLCEET